MWKLHLLATVLIHTVPICTSFVFYSKFPSSISTSLRLSPDAPIQQTSLSSLPSNERKTFKRFIQIELWRTPELESLYPILCSLEQACRDINRLMRRISTDDLEGNYGKLSKGTINIQGETQKKLDVIANRIMKISLCCSGKVDIVASEEDDLPCLCSEVTDNPAFSGGEFAAVFDPLDGSSNIDCGLPTGTIFGVYRKPKFGTFNAEDVLKQKGNDLVVAGYCLYSSATHIVITMRTGLHIFTLDDVTGEFYLTKSNVRIPRTGAIFSFNEANYYSWNPGVKTFLNDLKTGNLVGKGSQVAPRKPVGRYMGALVADSHNILLNGGIFGYPGSITKPKGKIRLAYEANPLAMILEEAGGMASDGYGRILDIPLLDIHQRTPIFLGSPEEVSTLMKYEQFYRK